MSKITTFLYIQPYKSIKNRQGRDQKTVVSALNIWEIARASNTTTASIESEKLHPPHEKKK